MIQFKERKRRKFQSFKPIPIYRLREILNALDDGIDRGFRVEVNAVGNLIVTDMFDNIYGYIDFMEREFCNDDEGVDYATD